MIRLLEAREGAHAHVLLGPARVAGYCAMGPWLTEAAARLRFLGVVPWLFVVIPQPPVPGPAGAPASQGQRPCCLEHLLAEL